MGVWLLCFSMLNLLIIIICLSKSTIFFKKIFIVSTIERTGTTKYVVGNILDREQKKTNAILPLSIMLSTTRIEKHTTLV